MLNALRNIWRKLFSRGESLEARRNRAFELYYHGIRTGQLKPADALPVWEKLEALEQRRGQNEALIGYQYLADYVTAVSRALIVPELGRGRNLHPQRFQWLYNGVTSGLISCDDLKMGATLRRLDPQAGNHPLHAKLWGDM